MSVWLWAAADFTDTRSPVSMGPIYLAFYRRSVIAISSRRHRLWLLSLQRNATQPNTTLA